MSPDKSEKDVGSSEIAESPQSTVPVRIAQICACSYRTHTLC